MKIFTKRILKQLPTPQETAHLGIDKQTVYVKLFGGSSCSWYIYAFDPDTREFLAFVNLGDPTFAECGYCSLDELLSIRFPPCNLPIERDLHFKPMNLKIVIDTIKSGGHI
jgi:hypothetical protein